MISQDPFGSVAGAVGQHATEVEPDSFSFGHTTVTAFQTGRVPDGGSTDIGFAVSDDGGQHWTHGFLPGVTTAATPPGPYVAASDASVAFDSKHNAWVISYLGITNGSPVDVLESRSTDGGHTWSDPVKIAATGAFFDKNWTGDAFNEPMFTSVEQARDAWSATACCSTAAPRTPWFRAPSSEAPAPENNRPRGLRSRGRCAGSTVARGLVAVEPRCRH